MSFCELRESSGLIEVCKVQCSEFALKGWLAVELKNAAA